MLHLHTVFDLPPGIQIDDYKVVLDRFSRDMVDRGLLVSTGPVMERLQHPIMDTDGERDQRYFFVMSFTDREQCDAAVRHIKAADPVSDPAHRAIYKDIICPIFSCWVDPD